MKISTPKWLLGALLAAGTMSASATDMPSLTTDTSNPTYYLIKNVRSSKYVSTPGYTGQLAQVDAATAITDEAYGNGALWYFTAATDAESTDSSTAVNIINAYTGKAIANVVSGTWADASTWYLYDNTSSSVGDNQGINIMTAATPSSANNGWNNYGGGGLLIGLWTGNDSGSTFTFEAANDETKVAKTLENIKTAQQTNHDSIITSGDQWLNIVKQLNANDAISTAWDEAKNANSAVTAESEAALNSAVLAIQNSFFNGAHVKIKYAGTSTGRESDYIAGNHTSGTPKAWDSEGAADVWTISGSVSNFKFYNEYENAYLRFPDDTSSHALFETNQASASTFAIEIETYAENLAECKFGIKCLQGNASYPYVHSNAGNNNSKNVVRWSMAPHSKWALEASDELEASKQYMAGAKADAEAITPNFGDQLGQYSGTDRDAFDAANSKEVSDTNSEDNRTNGQALRNILNSITFNEPQTGHFYRFKESTTGKYMSGVVSSSRLVMKTADEVTANPEETVFYYNSDKKLVSLYDGLCVGNFSGLWSSGLSTASNVGVFNVEPSSTNLTDNSVRITSNADQNRFIHGSGASVNAGSNLTDANDGGYRWIIEEVTELPVKVTENGVAGLYSPVALEVPAGVTAHLVRTNGDGYTITPGVDVVTANTGVYLKFEASLSAGDYVKFPITYGAATPTTSCNLTGSVFAIERAESTNYMAPGKNDDGVEGLAANTAEGNIPGFYPYVTASAADFIAFTEPAVVPGKFYRFKNVATNRYMGNVNNNGNRLDLITIAEGSTPGANTIFYLDPYSHVVSYTSGLALGQFLSGQATSNWRCIDVTNTSVSIMTFVNSTATVDEGINAYALQSANGRLLYGGRGSNQQNTQVDAAGNNATTLANTDYAWTIEEVTELPVAVNAGVGHATLFSPVALAIPTNGEVHIASLNENNLEKNQITTGVIPAKTPIVIEASSDITLTIASDSEAEAVTESDSEITNALSGSIYATSKASGSHYYVLNSAAATFTEDTADGTIPGFTAHLVSAEAGQTYTLTDPVPSEITDVETAAPAGKTVIYDLQGRRVARASKGIFIINGKKTLVK